MLVRFEGGPLDGQEQERRDIGIDRCIKVDGHRYYVNGLQFLGDNDDDWYLATLVEEKKC